MFYSTSITVLCIGGILICWLWVGLRAASKENEQLTQRLFIVAQNLQIAERMTGQPFYTSLLDGVLPCEKKEQLYLGIRNDFYGRCTTMLERQERMSLRHVKRE